VETQLLLQGGHS